MRLKSFFAAATMFAAAICAAPVHAGILGGDIPLEGPFSRLPDIGTSSIVSRLTLLDDDRAAGVEPGATGWFRSADQNATANEINLLGPTDFYYIVSDSLTGNTFIFTGTWTGIGTCTADKCISDPKDSPPPIQAAPEPGTAMLLGLAFGLLGFIIRRRRDA
jgi:hypothetical protein